MGACLPLHRLSVPAEKKKDSVVTWQDCVPFVPPVTGGQVIKVYDGDTITIASKLPWADSPLYRFSVRLNGIDTPEIKGKDDDEKELAKLARDFMSELILRKIVVLKNVSLEKYGRILADVYLGDVNLNKLMVEKRFAVTYDGGTKASPRSWMSYHTEGTLDSV